MDFSQKLKELRAEKGITQAELSEITNLSHGCIAMLEVGKRAPTGSTLVALADFFECSIDFLMGREDDFGNITIVSSGQQKNAGLKPDEKELLETFRKLDMKNKMHVISYATVRLEGQQERKTI